jgi:hypothetical protein
VFVCVLMKSYDYEGDDLIGVYKTKSKAMRHAPLPDKQARWVDAGRNEWSARAGYATRWVIKRVRVIP